MQRDKPLDVSMGEALVYIIVVVTYLH